ncbi:MAG: alpha/beta hydrolase [Prolixibacteraceae bacterium]
MKTKLFLSSRLLTSGFRLPSLVFGFWTPVFGLLLLFSVFSVNAQEIVHIWPGKVPGETKEKAEAVATKNEDGVLNRVSEVTDPLFTVHRPLPANDKNAGVIICPGGGYHILAINKEGYEVADWLNSLGYTAFVLQYRVPQKREGALMDIQRTVRLIRGNADLYGVKSDQLGVLGFSAGGSLAARASALYDKQTYEAVDSKDNESARPDFAVLVYAAYLDEGENKSLTPEIAVNENTPPMFLFATADDKHTSSSLAMSRALRDAGVPVELHILPFGKHGYGLRSGNIAATTWPLLAEIWLGRFVGYNPVTD